ncbi:hypothetical protein SAMN04487897_10936 [Paenibacillus sp. yr247]|nr:hypothetical protein SAMN04487897_10936 [Paenibacillus sp. yr247]
MYQSDFGNHLLGTMGWRSKIDATRMMMFRDAVSFALAAFFIVKQWISGGNLSTEIVLLLLIYSLLTPGTHFSIPSTFTYTFVPIFQKVRRFRVSRESAMFLQLLRNEVSEKTERQVISIIQQYQSYFKVLRNDLIDLEHDFPKGKDVALERFKSKHPQNEEINYICSILDKLADVGYAECAQMLKDNEETLNKMQEAHYESKEKDLNQLLMVINLGGIGLAALWFVIACFMWSYSFDTNP